MSNTTQLRALRDAATKHFPKGDVFAADMARLCDRAIAALEAEGAKACEGFVCSYPPCPKGEPHSDIAPCRTCGQPYSAHQQPAEQPARTAVPPMPPRHTKTVYSPTELLCHERDVQQVIAAAQTIAAERDAALERAEKAEAELAAVKARLLECPACRQLCHTTRADEDGNHRCAECELAALKAQEPVAWWWIEDGLMHEPSREAFTSNRLAAAPSASPLYAAPVASIPLAQHEAALAEARRDERERCAKVCEGLSDLDLYVRESSALMEAGAAIRALRDGEG